MKLMSATGPVTSAMPVPTCRAASAPHKASRANRRRVICANDNRAFFLNSFFVCEGITFFQKSTHRVLASLRGLHILYRAIQHTIIGGHICASERSAS